MLKCNGTLLRDAIGHHAGAGIRQAGPGVMGSGCWNAGVCEVLTQCSNAMAPCSEMLLGIVLALASDEWAQVSGPCRAFLGGSSAMHQAPSQRRLVTGLISKLMAGLADAARGSEEAFILHARRLSTAIQVSLQVAPSMHNGVATDEADITLRVAQRHTPY